MTATEIIIWIVCPIGLITLLSGFTILVLRVYKDEKNLISLGERDSEVLKNSSFEEKKKTKRANYFFLSIEVIIYLFIFFLIFIGIYSAAYSNDFPLFGIQMKVVGSNSMATIHERNKYLVENNLKNQFEYDDIIFMGKLPDESDLKQYDIVTYKDKKTGLLIIHRIREITVDENGKKHYILRGDSNVSDDKPITYEDMRGIYQGKKLDGAGIIIRFMQSWFGIISIVSCIYICVANEVYDHFISKVYGKRLLELQPDETAIKQE